VEAIALVSFFKGGEPENEIWCFKRGRSGYKGLFQRSVMILQLYKEKPDGFNYPASLSLPANGILVFASSY